MDEEKQKKDFENSKGTFVLPQRTHDYGRCTVSRFKVARYYLAPQIDLDTGKCYLYVKINIFLKGKWVTAGKFRLYEKDMLFYLHEFDKYRIKELKSNVKRKKR